jgi:hypothetical protein
MPCHIGTRRGDKPPEQTGLCQGISDIDGKVPPHPRRDDPADRTLPIATNHDNGSFLSSAFSLNAAVLDLESLSCQGGMRLVTTTRFDGDTGGEPALHMGESTAISASVPEHRRKQRHPREPPFAVASRRQPLEVSC